MGSNKKILLVIWDGWGIAKNPSVSAVDRANTPFIDSLCRNYPNSKLEASGRLVGLPDGQMGNSEVGHMNLGAGRVVYQMLQRIGMSIENGEMHENTALKQAFSYAKQNDKAVHFIGLLSDGGVHAHVEHLKGLMQSASNQGLSKLFLHAFTDGRDTDPKSGIKYLVDIKNFMQPLGGHLASITGRYYAMDRDKRWERVKLVYDALVHARGMQAEFPLDALKDSYDKGITDEFVLPIIATNKGKPIARIQPDDVVVFFNFRSDRARQLTEVLTQRAYKEYNMQPVTLHFLSMTSYDDSYKNINVIFSRENIEQTLGEVLSNHQKTQIRIAETEKYPHVTYFFSGGREAPFEGERRILCPSPKVKTYDLQPEMSAYAICQAIVPEIRAQSVDFICLNFANPDMVGHTGNMAAAVKACETIDECTQILVEQALESSYSVIILSDHGNADFMINEDKTPNTAHTTQPVPFIFVDKDADLWKLSPGKLGDIAPSILHLMQLPIPKQMTGNVLIKEKRKAFI